MLDMTVVWIADAESKSFLFFGKTFFSPTPLLPTLQLCVDRFIILWLVQSCQQFPHIGVVQVCQANRGPHFSNVQWQCIMYTFALYQKQTSRHSNKKMFEWLISIDITNSSLRRHFSKNWFKYELVFLVIRK